MPSPVQHAHANALPANGKKPPVGEKPKEESKVVITHCPLFSHDLVLKGLYHKAYSGPHGKYPDNVQHLEAIARHIIKKYYPAFRPKELKIEIQPPSKDHYATVEFNPDPRVITPIKVPANTFESQAGLGSTLGHEIIHKLQASRVYQNIYFLGLNKIVGNFRELEAHTWELDSKSFPWTIGENKFRRYLTKEQLDEAKASQNDYREGIASSISELLTGIRANTYGPQLEKWLKQDEWVSKVWLADPANRAWDKEWVRPPKE